MEALELETEEMVHLGLILWKGLRRCRKIKHSINTETVWTINSILSMTYWINSGIPFVALL